MSYTKLFSHIITSSVWSENDQTRVLWITLLALSNKHGEVMAAIPGLAKVASLSIASTEEGIARLMSPDKHSRTKDDEGRRITEIDGGWHILNYEKHRRMASFDEEKQKNAERQRRWRERHAKSVTNSNGSNAPNNAPVTPSIDKAEAEAKAQADLVLGTEPEKVPIPRKKSPERKPTLPTTEIPIRMAKLFRRRLTTPWSEKEFKAFKTIGAIEAGDMDLIERYYASERKKGTECGRYRRDLVTFLNNFRGELDRATAMFARKPEAKKSNGYDPDEWASREAYDRHLAKQNGNHA